MYVNGCVCEREQNRARRYDQREGVLKKRGKEMSVKKKYNRAVIFQSSSLNHAYEQVT